MIRGTLTALATASILAAPAAAFDIDAMDADERAAFREEIRAYLLENPEVLMEAIAVLEERQAAEQEMGDRDLVAAYADALFDDGYSWVGGNPDGDITMVEFLDYRCGFCRRAHPEVSELVASDGNIRLIVKEFPILGEESVLASRFAIATKMLAGDDAYKNVHDELMEIRGAVTETALKTLAVRLELDADAILAQMNSDDVNQIIAANRELAQAMQISGTPTFVLGGQMLRGFLPLDGMREMVAQERG